MDRCPVCQRKVVLIWQNNGEGWFAGSYKCLQCGVITASGGVKENGAIEVYSWHPACPVHGSMDVVHIHGRTYGCLVPDCRRYFEARNGRIIMTQKAVSKISAEKRRSRPCIPENFPEAAACR